MLWSESLCWQQLRAQQADSKQTAREATRRMPFVGRPPLQQGQCELAQLLPCQDHGLREKPDRDHTEARLNHREPGLHRRHIDLPPQAVQESKLLSLHVVWLDVEPIVAEARQLFSDSCRRIAPHQLAGVLLLEGSKLAQHVHCCSTRRWQIADEAAVGHARSTNCKPSVEQSHPPEQGRIRQAQAAHHRINPGDCEPPRPKGEQLATIRCLGKSVALRRSMEHQQLGCAAHGIKVLLQ
mmetsp:Transcript_29155/g.73183  ORF Transcript_29155/g.73183 Transcript_29155/m.73183 type:complete len:239 (-) Transcript_29155:165-881(-)